MERQEDRDHTHAGIRAEVRLLHWAQVCWLQLPQDWQMGPGSPQMGTSTCMHLVVGIVATLCAAAIAGVAADLLLLMLLIET
jgi:hypothetical protein